MIRIKTTTFILLLFVAHLATGQTSIEQMRKDILFLTDSSLLGRESGTKQAEIAADYIAKRMKEIGLKPYDSKNGFYQQFNLHFPVIFEDAKLTVNKREFKYKEDFWITDFSGSGTAVGTALELKCRQLNSLNKRSETEFLNKIILLDLANYKDIDNDFDLIDTITETVKTIADKGAAGIIMYNTSDKPNVLLLFGSTFTDTVDIPVIFIKKSSYSKIRRWRNTKISLTTNVERTTTTPTNVIGKIDNNSDKTVVIGAHYDHLGVKLSINSNREEVFNGADDNASGVALMLQLAEWMLYNESINYNYLFVAFDAEEKGLWGSKYFCNNKYINNDSIYYMLNIDMVGRLGVLGDSIQVFGTGSAESWNNILDKISCDDFGVIRRKNSPPMSDHFSFYSNEIPVAFITTGLHEQYHQPTDDEHLINYEGMAKVLQYTRQFLRIAERDRAIKFSETKE
ncbi:MAG: M28 family peptidase [Lentimicrobiaceae bacterium]|nr:M28 family peptidase [Lentimicrobiaceae bacterium]